jgi:hypothetical protein
MTAKKDTKKKPSDDRSLADILFPYQDELDYSESILNIPPEQRRLVTETYDFSISTILESLKDGRIYIPEYQRGYVWNDVQASRLIESLVIQCPIPVIYLSQTADEKFQVIDGNQRVSSIKRYIDGKFSLKGLTAYPELEGVYYNDLDPRFKRHILHRTLRCIAILKETHPQVKFDIFERINTGAVQLTPQELRHGIYNGPFIKLLDDLAEEQVWTKMIEPNNLKRMKSQELILRFFALHNNFDNYSQPLSGFLNEYLSINRNIGAKEQLKYKTLFLNTVKKVDHLFGNLAFKFIDTKRGDFKLKQFNAALFDAAMLGINNAQIDVLKMSSKEINSFLAKYKTLFANEDFINSINRATTNKNSIIFRVNTLVELLEGHKNEVSKE